MSNKIIKIENTQLSTSKHYLRHLESLLPHLNYTFNNDSMYEEFFNEAFYLINSKHIQHNSDNYIYIIENSYTYLKDKDFKYVANSNKDYKKAIKLFTTIIVKYPSCKYAYYFRGIANAKLFSQWESDYSLADHYMPAISDYSKTIEIDPSDFDVYTNRADSYRDWADWHQDMLYYKLAISDYSKAIEINPKSSYAYYYRGCVKMVIANYEGAIEDYSKVIEINPNFPDAYYNRGNVKEKLKDYEGAIVDFSMVIEINPQFLDVYYCRGNAKGELKDYKGVIEDYSKAIEINSNPHSYAYYQRGYAKFVSEDYEGAIGDFDQAIALSQDYAEAYYWRAQTKIKLGNVNEAKTDQSIYNDLIRHNDNPELQF